MVDQLGSPSSRSEAVRGETLTVIFFSGSAGPEVKFWVQLGPPPPTGAQMLPKFLAS